MTFKDFCFQSQQCCHDNVRGKEKYRVISKQHILNQPERRIWDWKYCPKAMSSFYEAIIYSNLAMKWILTMETNTSVIPVEKE